jgi:hypothetical protein
LSSLVSLLLVATQAQGREMEAGEEVKKHVEVLHLAGVQSLLTNGGKVWLEEPLIFIFAFGFV